MNSIDYIILAIYLLMTIGLGYILGRKQSNCEDYFLAGRKMSWWPIAISLFASLFSAISYIAMPGEAYNFGMNMSLSGIVQFLPMPIMIFVFLKLFYRLKLWTAYEYLELRFCCRIRALGSCSFMVLRTVYLGIVLYATANLMHDAVGWPMYLSIIVIGAIGTLYTALGGMAAVVWTDVIQFFVLLGGVILIIGFVAFHVDGGLLGIWQTADAMGHGFDLSTKGGFWNFDFNIRITVWAWLIAAIPLCISPAVDQINLQRCLSCKDFRTAVTAVIATSIVGVPLTFLFYYAGLSVLVYFHTVAPGVLPETNSSGDKAFTWFVANILPVGVRGLLVAAILSAVLSTVDSVINSLTTVAVKDIYQRFINTSDSEEHYLRVAKILTLVWGGISILSGIIIVWIYATRDVSLLEISYAALGMLGGFLLGLFIVGLMSLRGNSPGVALGFVVGVSLTLYVYITMILLPDPTERLSFIWIGLLASSSVALFGYLASLVFGKMGFGRVPQEIEKYVIWCNIKKTFKIQTKEIES